MRHLVLIAGCLLPLFSAITLPAQGVLNSTRTEDGTVWELTESLLIGSGAGQTGSLNLINGGQAIATAFDITLGTGAASASGSVAISGANSTLNLTGGTTLRVGDSGLGTITVADGGTLLTQNVQLASQPNSNGTLTLTGTGTSWNTRRWTLRVGAAGTGTVNLLAGSLLTNTTHIIVGDEATGSGTLNVLGSATLSMGIETTAPYLRLGNAAGSTGTMRVAEGAQVTGTDFLYVGHDGQGTLTVESGATFNTRNNVYVARMATAAGDLLIQGDGSRFETTHDLRIAASATLAPTGGTALVRVRDGAALSTGRNLVIRQGGTLRIAGGGTVEVAGNIEAGAGADAGNLILEGGSLQFAGTFDAAAPGFAWTTGTLHAHGALSQVGSVPAGAALVLDHGSVTSVTGTLTLGTGASLTGNGFILANVHLGAGSILRGEGGLLVVLGDISGTGTVENITQEIRPATVVNGVEVDPIGTLEFSANLNFSNILSGATEPVFRFDLGTPAHSDRIHFNGAEVRFGTNGLSLGAFEFTTHAGFGDGVYPLISSTEWIGGSLGAQRRGFVDGRPVWLRISNDGRTVELRVGEAATASPFSPGEIIYGRNQYNEYQVGDLPLILTSGHDGGLQPGEIPARTWGTTARDTNTMPQTLAVADEIFTRTGRRPHVILNHLHRTRLDPNREIIEAAQGNVHAEQAWSEYHETFIQAARDAAEAQAGFALVFDMHGHGHDIKRLELGYLLGATELNVNDDTLNLPGYAWQSSLRSLMLRNPGLPFSELIRGQRSLGSLFNDRSVPAWPSAEFPTIGTAPFFSGGFTTSNHACLDSNCPTDAIQIESHGDVRSSASARQTFAVNFVRVLQSYLVDSYGYSLDTNAFYTLSAGTTSTSRGGPPLVITVNRSGYRAFTSTFSLDFAGTAIKGVDYTLSTETVSFASGASSATVTLTPIAAGPAFGDRTVVVSMLPDYRQSTDSGTLTLTLGDGVSQTVRVHALAATASSADGEIRFRLERTRTDGALPVNLAWEGSAVAGGHFIPPAEVWFPHGTAETEVVCRVRTSGIFEDDRTVILRVTPSGDYLAGHPASAETRLTAGVRPTHLALWLADAVAGNVWSDRSGHARHATTLPAGTGPAAVTANGHPAVRFDGRSATAAAPRFEVDPDGAFSVTFHFRLQPGATTNEHNLLTYGPRGELGSLAIYLTSATNLRTWLGQPPLSTANALNVTRSWTDGQWRHYALAVAADGTARVYIDGVLANQSTTWAPPLRPNQLFWIGWNPARRAAAGFLEGDLRDFRVYQSALTAAEVQALAEGGLSQAAWLDQFGLADPQLGWDADTLARGYAFAAHPDHLADIRSFQAWTGEPLALAFQRQLQAADLRYRIEGSATLQPGAWQVLAELPAGAATWTLFDSHLELTDRHGWVEFRDARPLLDDDARRFLRLRAIIE